MVKVQGRSNISATIVADSINPDGVRLTTFELEFPRWILAEVNTHAMLSRNTASSRAIPVERVLEQVDVSPALPVEWGQNNPGMVSKTLLDELKAKSAELVWKSAAKSASAFARVLSDKVGLNVHKQLAGRLIETFTMSKTVMTGTEFANFFSLREHSDAQPEFYELAKCMRQAREQSTPSFLVPDQWHLPYVDLVDGKYYVSGIEVDLETAKKVSASCCAQVSYRKLDDSIDKAVKVFDMLKLSDPEYKQKHSSPTTHQATPIGPAESFDPSTWPAGVTHVRRDGSLWSGNLRGWVQFRQLIPNEAVWG